MARDNKEQAQEKQADQEVSKEAANEENRNSAIKAEIDQKTKHLMKRLPALGPIVLLYLQTGYRRFQFISDLEWLVFPPLMKGQSKLYMKDGLPVSYVSWAFINEEVEKRLIKNAGKLSPDEWDCGDRLWLMDVVAPFGGINQIFNDLQNVEFPGRTIRMLAPDPKTGGVVMRELKKKEKTEKTPAS